MKEWKDELANAIIKRSESDKIITVKDIAAEMGIRHITRQDTQDILNAVQKRLPGYRRCSSWTIPRPACSSLWHSSRTTWSSAARKNMTTRQSDREKERKS